MNLIYRAIRRDDDSGIAMASVIMLMIIVMGLSIIMLGLVIAQVKPTLVNAKSTRTVSAAQAGLDAAVSQIRASLIEDASGEIMGDIRKLPCAVSGNVDGSGDPTRFVATITYYETDPTNQPREWRADPANQLVCRTAGAQLGLSQVPGYALLSAEGFDSGATTLTGKIDRTVEATYKFSLKTVNVAGGRIYSGGKQYCLVASAIADGATITYESAGGSRCQEPTDFNRWLWDTDYMIHLGSSKSAGTDLCISGRPPLGTSSNRQHVTATLRPCTTTTQDPLGQRWSWRHGATWEGQNAANTSTYDMSFSTIENTDLSGQVLRITSTGYDQGAPHNSFDPEPTVGAGNASHSTKQIVNLLEFGRCLDVFRDKLWMPYHILYPCKQDPSGSSNFRWNHKWVYEEPAEGTSTTTTQIVVTPTIEGASGFSWYGGFINNPFCLLRPNSNGLPTAQTPHQIPPFNTDGVDMRNFSYPRFTDSMIFDYNPNAIPTGFGSLCTDVNRSWWIRTTESSDAKLSWTFRPTQAPNLCLSANGPRHHGSQTSWAQAHPSNRSGANYNYYVDYGGNDLWSTIIVEPCNGSMAQKWNADPNNPGSPLRDFVEIKGNG